MTENEIKAMLKDIIDNGAEYEYTYKDYNGDYVPWRPYELGEKIYFHREYRKIEKWYVNLVNGSYCNFVISKDKTKPDIVFEGTKEECEKWVEEHTKKTWMQDYLENDYFEFDSEMYIAESSIKEVCKKILEEVKKYCEHTDELVGTDELADIIKNLGVEVKQP